MSCSSVTTTSSKPGRLSRSRSSSMHESASPESTSSDSHSSSDQDTSLSFTSLSPLLQTPNSSTGKSPFSMDVDVASILDMDADITFNGQFDLQHQAINAFQGCNINLDDIITGIPTHSNPNVKADMLMLEEIIKDGAFEPSSNTVPSFTPYSTRSPSMFRDAFMPPPPSVHPESHIQPQPEPVGIDPSSTQSQFQSILPTAVQSPSPIVGTPAFKTEPSGVLLLSPNAQANNSASVKQEPRTSFQPSLLSYDSPPSTLLSSEIVLPPKEACIDLPIFFPSVPVAGTKSRVETQIKLGFELGFPISTSDSLSRARSKITHLFPSPQSSSSSSSGSNSRSTSPVPGNVSDGVAIQRPTHDKVGSYSWLRLPRGTATKRRPSGAANMRREPSFSDEEETLEMSAEVVCCSPPHTLVHSCASCQGREAKRTARKLAARVRPPPGARVKQKANASVKKSGKKTKEDDVAEDAQAEDEEEQEPNADGSIIQFNCAETVDFSGGSIVLPMRITCYCRHHKEKIGFNIIFTLRDHVGRVVGRGTTPPILITDDHKSTSAVSKLPPMHPLRQALIPPALPAAVVPAPPTSAVVLEGLSPQVRLPEQTAGRAPAKRRDADVTGRKRRPKPYDGRPANRPTGIDGRQGVVLALHPARVHSQDDVTNGVGERRDSVPSTTSASIASPEADPEETVSPPPAPLRSSPVTQQSFLPLPEASFPSPPHSLNGIFTPREDVVMSTLDAEPGFSRSPSPPTATSSSFSPTTPPSPASLSPPSFQADHRALQHVQQPLPDLQSFPQDHHGFLDPSLFPLYPSVELTACPPLPKIHRLIPSSGPTTGGIEITVLGSNFSASLPLECVFGGTVASSTHRWSDNTLVCVLPPRATPGLVSVGFKDIKDDSGQDEGGGGLFNYVDESDRQLMELALQVVGLKMTGKIEEARNVAMRIVGNTNSPTPTMTSSELSQMASLSGASYIPHSFLGSLGGMDLQTLIIKLLTLFEVPPDDGMALPTSPQAISHQNATGQTLLHLAVLLGLPALVSCLAERCIDLDTRNNNGLTALHFAALSGWKEGAEILLSAGADASIVDRMGLTPADRAKQGHFGELEGLFEEAIGRESVLEGESGEDGDDEAWHSEDEASEDDISEAESSLSWSAVPPQYTAQSRMASPRRLDSSSEELSEAKPLSDLSKVSNAQSETTPTDIPTHQASVDVKPVLNEKHDASFVERLQRTLPQGILPNVQIPGFPQLQLPDVLAAPWGALPQIPVFPVFVPIPNLTNLPHLPNWPAFPWPDALGGEKKEDRHNEVAEEKQQQPPLAMLWTAYDNLANNAWRVHWEKWTAHVTALQNANARGTEPPPIYTPRREDQQSKPKTRVSATDELAASPRGDATVKDTPEASTSRPPTLKATRRMKYGLVKVPETEVDLYHYQPKRITNQKKDRMLVLFWIPILFIGLAYALYTTLPVAVVGLAKATRGILPQLPSRDELRLLP